MRQTPREIMEKAYEEAFDLVREQIVRQCLEVIAGPVIVRDPAEVKIINEIGARVRERFGLKP